MYYIQLYIEIISHFFRIKNITIFLSIILSRIKWKAIAFTILAIYPAVHVQIILFIKDATVFFTNLCNNMQTIVQNNANEPHYCYTVVVSDFGYSSFVRAFFSFRVLCKINYCAPVWPFHRARLVTFDVVMYVMWFLSVRLLLREGSITKSRH